MDPTNPEQRTQRRYRAFAPLYDVLSLERVLYRQGRAAAVGALDLHQGQQVLDVGCGTGLSMPLLSAAVGTSGHVIGVDASPAMLSQAGNRSISAERTLIESDAQELSPTDLRKHHVAQPPQAALFAYALSLMPDWQAAWQQVISLLAPGSRVAIVDVAPPTTGGPLVRGLARVFARIGRSDLDARPWQALEQTCTAVEHQSFRGGHVQVWAGTLP